MTDEAHLVLVTKGGLKAGHYELLLTEMRRHKLEQQLPTFILADLVAIAQLKKSACMKEAEGDVLRAAAAQIDAGDSPSWLCEVVAEKAPSRRKRRATDRMQAWRGRTEELGPTPTELRG